MPAFTLEHEQRRLAESGLTWEEKVQSTKASVRTLINERVHAPSPFSITATRDIVTSIGYGQRGDLKNSFQKSVKEARTDRIAQRYELENRGFEAAKKEFFNLPLYSTVVLFSPPPEIPIPGYPGHSMAYFYHILPGENENVRDIKALAWINNFSKTEQAHLLNQLHGELRTAPTEESILLSPVAKSSQPNEDSFTKIWSSIEQKFKQQEGRDFLCPPGEVMKQLLLNGEEFMKRKFSTLDIVMEEVAKRLSEGATEEEMADEFNIMLNLADRELLYKDWGKVETESMDIPVKTESLPPAGLIFARNMDLTGEVRVVSTTCDLSGGMNNGRGSALGNPISLWGFRVYVEESKPEEKQRAEDDPNLCKKDKCPKVPHFDCPGKVENDEGKEVNCSFKVIVGKGVKKCPECKLDATCA